MVSTNALKQEESLPAGMSLDLQNISHGFFLSQRRSGLALDSANLAHLRAQWLTRKQRAARHDAFERTGHPELPRE